MKSIKNIFVICLSNFLLLFLLIFIFELFSSFFVSKLSQKSQMADYRLNHIWTPNGSLYVDKNIAKPKFVDPYTLYFNNEGWVEDYDINILKPDNTYRVFYVGDSFTAGAVEMSGNVPTLVEDELNKVKGDDITNIEVINTGTSSYSPTLYYLLTKYKILKYKPDIIIVNIDMTDDFDDWKYSETLITDGQGKPIACPRRDVVNSAYIDTENGAVEMTLNTKIQFYLMLNSYSFNFLTKVRNKLVKNDIKKTEFKNNEMYQRWSWCKYVWDDSTKANVNRTFDLLKELVSLCRSNNAKIMFTSIPHYQQYNSDIESGIKPYGPRYHILRLKNYH